MPKSCDPGGGRWALLVGIATWIVWCACIRGPYHFDDLVTPLDDPASQGIAAFVEHAPTTLRPLTKLTYALEASAGLSELPWARRIVSAGLQGGVAVLLVILALGEARRRAGVLARAGVVTIALLAFGCAIHPIQAEQVLELAGRSSLLAEMLVLAACAAMQRDRRFVAAGTFALACMARETAICALLPLAVLALRDGMREGVARLAPVLATAAVCLAMFAANARMAELAHYSAAIPLAPQWAAVPHGLALWVQPQAMSVDHGEELGTVAAALGLAILVISVVAPIASLVRARRTAWPFALAILGAALVPTQSVIGKLDALTERPFACALACVPLWLAGTELPRIARSWLVAAAWCGFAAWGLAIRAPLYASEVALWADAAAKSVTNARPYQNWIVSLDEAGQRGAAMAALAEARRKFPWDRGLRLTEEMYREVIVTERKFP